MKIRFLKATSSDHFWYLGFAILIFLIFGQSLTSSLLAWDDTFHICKNPYFSSSQASLLDLWKAPFLGLYAPLTYTVWGACVALARAVFGASSSCSEWGAIFHGLNLLLHFANTILVFKLLKKIGEDQPPLYPALGAMLFALHPMQVETVAWVSGARDLLSFFFGTSAILLAFNKKWIPATLCFTLSCLAKATGIVFPLLLAGLFLYKRRPRELMMYIPAFVSSLGFGLAAKTLQPDSALQFVSPVWQRPFIFGHNLGFYFYKLLLPVNLVPDYTRSIYALQQDPSMFWPLAVLLVMIVLMVLLKQSFAITALMLIAISVLPVSGLFPFGFEETSTVADRYFYTAMLGVSFLVAHLLHRYSKPAVARMTFLGLVALALLSFRQTAYWQNDETLFGYNLKLYPESSVSHLALSDVYFAKGDFQSSLHEIQTYLAAKPLNALVAVKLGVVLEKSGQVAEAEKVYLAAIDQNIKSTEIFNNLGRIQFIKGDYQNAERYWLKAVQENATNFESQFNLGQLYLNQNHFEAALAAFHKAKSILPHHPLIDGKIREVQDKTPR